jgi:flagellin FlaB
MQGKFMSLLKNVWQNQRGITGLETAIVLIAFVVVASVFAFVVITTGLYSGQRAQETANAGLNEAKTSLAPRGSLLALQATVSGATTATNAVLTDAAATFVTDGVKAGDTIENLTDGSNAIATAVAETTVTGVLVNGTNNTWTSGDTYRVGLANTVSQLKFKVTLGAGSSPVGLGSDTTLVSFVDDNNTVNATYASPIPASLVERVYWTHAWPVAGTGGPSLDVGEVVEFTVDVNNITSGVTGSQTLGPNRRFNIQVLPRNGSALTLSRTLPVELKPVMDLN